MSVSVISICFTYLFHFFFLILINEDLLPRLNHDQSSMISFCLHLMQSNIFDLLPSTLVSLDINQFLPALLKTLGNVGLE